MSKAKYKLGIMYCDAKDKFGKGVDMDIRKAITLWESVSIAKKYWHNS